LLISMPPLAEIHVPVLRDLVGTIARAPRAGVAACLQRVEAFAGEIDAAAAYPEEYVAFRVLGVRDGVERPGMTPGEALLASLSAFAERVCDDAGVSLDETRAALGAGGMVEANELAKRWGIARKTLDRLRRDGLIARRVRGEGGRPVLVFAAASAEKFRERNAARLSRASAFSRIDGEMKERIIRRAARYRRVLGCSLNQAALRLAKRFDRSHEGVRQVLMRNERGAMPIFKQAAPIDRRFGRFAHRAWLRGFDASAIARRKNRSLAGVRRAINMRRAELLRSLLEGEALAAHVSPSFARADARREFLEHGPVRSGLMAAATTDLLDFIDACRERVTAVGVEETTRLAAYSVLKYEARERIAGLDAANPAAGEIDEIETMLRHAARLKAALVRPQLRLMLETLESTIGRQVTSLRAGDAAALMMEAVTRVGEAVEQFDPFRHQRQRGVMPGRLAAPIGLVIGRLAAKWVREHDEGGREGAKEVQRPRAQPTLLRGTVIEDWSLRVCVWQGLVDLPSRLMGAAERVSEPSATVVRDRFGLGERPPCTLDELAGRMAWSHIRAVKEERRAMRELVLAAARGELRASTTRGGERGR
jgi:hypothetical protein